MKPVFTYTEFINEKKKINPAYLTKDADEAQWKAAQKSKKRKK